MSLLEVIIIGTIILGCLAYIVIFVRRPFKDTKNPCAGCPYGDICDNKDGN